jgi:putative effector of murein hydrolase LrgA (UPF0299 family)
LLLAFIFFGVWIVSFLVFHVAAALIHVLLFFALISLVIHFLWGRRSA